VCRPMLINQTKHNF